MVILVVPSSICMGGSFEGGPGVFPELFTLGVKVSPWVALAGRTHCRHLWGTLPMLGAVLSLLHTGT